uniref:Ion channel n=1 Tax=Panagrellus redivivus TaxID=6233 RepID=A0A7E4V5H5_PANRE
MKPFWKGIASICIDFSAWTTTHGVPHIGLAKSTVLRVIWSIIFCACVFMFVYQFITIITKFLSYPVNVDTSLSYGSRVFPTVTICNLNAYKVNAVGSNTALANLVTAYQSTNANANYGFTSNPFYDKVIRTVKWMNLFFNDIVSQDETYGTTYTYDDLFISCSYNTNTCNGSDFVSYYDPFYGKCYTFNSEGTQTSSRAGPLYGLSLLLRTNQAQYLPWTVSAGAVFYAYDKDDLPFMYTFGYQASTGMASSVGLRYVEKTKLSAPYSTCTDKGSSQPIYYETDTYQLEACIQSCIQDEIIATCGCYDPTFGVADDANSTCCYTSDLVTTNTNVDCILTIVNADGITGYNVFDECDCPQACTASNYEITLSTAYWPANAYTPTECIDSESDYIYWTKGNTNSCTTWYRDNTVYLEIFYEEMSYQVLTESAAYTLLNVISDTGGQVGLWLGMSVVSLIEILTLILVLICYCITRPKDAYLSEFDDNDLMKQLHEERKAQQAKDLQQKQKLDAKDLYDESHDMPLPPAVQHAK